MAIIGICNIFAKKFSSMDKIIGIGNALVDALATIGSDDLLHEIGLPKGGMQPVGAETLERINRIFAHTTRKFTTGGAVCNSVMAMAHLGMRPGVVGMVGRDSFGDFFRQSFREAGVDVRLKDGDLPTGVASTFITPDGQRTFGTFLGAAGAMTPDDLPTDAFQGYDILFVEGYLVQNHELVERACQLAKEAGMKICYDLASYNIVEADRDFIVEMVDKYVDIVFANEEEAKAFAQTSPEEAINDLGSRCEVAVVKLGAQGAMIRRGGETVRVDAMEVQKVVDTTAAGDFFAAGFMYGYLQGASLEKCGRIGSILAGHVIQTVGTVLPEDTWHEIKLNVNTILSE